MRWAAVLLGVLCHGCASSGYYDGWRLVEDQIGYANFFSIPTSVGLPICTSNTDSHSLLILPIDGTSCHRLSEGTDLIEAHGSPFVTDDYEDLDGFVAWTRDLNEKYRRGSPAWKTEVVRYERLLADELETIVVTDRFADGRYIATAYAMLSLDSKWGRYIFFEYTVMMQARERERVRADALFMKVLRAIDLTSAK